MVQNPTVYKHVVKIDNEGKRTIGGHILAKKMGLHTGASDLFIAWPTKTHPGLWLEIKKDGWRGAYGKKEKLHLESQIRFLDTMKAAGYAGHLVVGVDEGIKAIRTYLKG